MLWLEGAAAAIDEARWLTRTGEYTLPAPLSPSDYSQGCPHASVRPSPRAARRPRPLLRRAADQRVRRQLRAPTTRRSRRPPSPSSARRRFRERSSTTLLAQVCVQYKAAKKACPKPGTAARKQLQQSFVAQLVQQAEFDVAGKQLKVAVKQKDVDASLQKLELQYAKGADGKVDDAKWKKVLSDNHTSEANVLDNIRDGLLRQAIYVKLTKNITVTGLGRQDATTPRTRRTTPRPPAGRSATSWSRTRRWPTRSTRSSPRSDAQFAALAKKYTIDPGLEEERRQARQHPEGPDRPELRQGRLQRRDRQGRQARQEQLRLARDRGHGAIPSRHRSSRSTRR